MAALIEAITVKRKMFFEFENTPYYCLEAEVSLPPRGGPDLGSPQNAQPVHARRLDKTFKAGDRFKEPDPGDGRGLLPLQRQRGSHFLDQESFETHTLSGDRIGNALDFLSKAR